MKHEHCLHQVNIEDVSVSRNGKPVFEHVNLSVHCGELTALIGPNGAGKTTLLRALLGEVEHTGRVTYTGHAGQVLKAPVTGYVPQNLMLDKSSPVTVLDLFATYHNNLPVCFGIPKKVRMTALDLLSMVQAAHLIDRKLGVLSGGELQRVLLAFALYPSPSLLLLDEPVTGVDNRGLELFYKLVVDLLSDVHLSIILVSHDLNLVAKYADKVAFLDSTLSAFGTPEEVFRRPEVSRALGYYWKGDAK